MNMNLYTIYDVKSQVHSPLVSQVNDEVAVRTIANCVNNPEHPYGQNPEDFKLYKIGIFNDIDGLIETLAKSKLITDLNALVKPLEETT